MNGPTDDRVFGFGLCQCGCGRKTSIATQNNKARNEIKGKPKAFVTGHRWSMLSAVIAPSPPRTGLCACGCGGVTSPAKSTRRNKGVRQGEPQLYLPNHHKRCTSLVDRFNAFVYPDPNSGCFIWGGTETNGYGRFQIGYKTYNAHRIAWELANGPIPDGLVVRHKCDQRYCVNPDHLELGTAGDNVSRRGNALPLGVSVANSKFKVMVTIPKSGKQLYLGVFTTVEEAAAVAAAARAELYGAKS